MAVTIIIQLNIKCCVIASIFEYHFWIQPQFYWKHNCTKNRNMDKVPFLPRCMYIDLSSRLHLRQRIEKPNVDISVKQSITQYRLCRAAQAGWGPSCPCHRWSHCSRPACPRRRENPVWESSSLLLCIFCTLGKAWKIPPRAYFFLKLNHYLATFCPIETLDSEWP